MANTTRVRDIRQPGHFWADNEIVDDYLPAIGVYGFAVYMMLAKHSNAKTGQCDPSVEGLARKLGISSPTVRKALDKLEETGLITIRHRHKERGGKLINQTSIYTLLAVPKRQTDIPTKGDLVPNDIDQGGQPDLPGVLNVVDQGTKGDLPGVLNHVSSNKTHENKKESVGGKKDQSTTPAPFFQKLADVCNINLEIALEDQRAQLAQVATKLSTSGATVKHLDTFAAWWWSDSNWRTRKANQDKRKPEAPRPRDVLSEWGNAVLTNGHRPADRGPPVKPFKPDENALTPEQIKQKAREYRP